ncbi:MAG: zinc-ribbon domain-containing protein [Bacteroidales bacterium]|nr:zinc-ribbon domain-containing protein [Bacteroidales bacterium]
MKCSKCNAEIDDDAKFCPECGSKIEKFAFCSNCGAKLEEGATFCSNCGEKIGCLPTDKLEKKDCPFCGKEILATATKCKHCGEWLDDENDDEGNINEIEKEDNITLLKRNVPLSDGLTKTALWVAIIGLLISYGHTLADGLDLNLKSIMGAGRGAIVLLLTYIPEWIGTVLETIGFVTLLFSLKVAMSKLKRSFGSLFSWLIITDVVSAISVIYMDFNDSVGIIILCLMFGLTETIIQLILGIKISSAYNDEINLQGEKVAKDYEINKFGKTMCICAIINLMAFVFMFILSIITAVTYLPDDNANTKIILALVPTLVSIFYYDRLKRILLK